MVSHGQEGLFSAVYKELQIWDQVGIAIPFWERPVWSAVGQCGSLTIAL